MTSYVIWERKTRQVVGAPLLFDSAANANAHVASLQSLEGRWEFKPVRTYDVVAVTT